MKIVKVVQMTAEQIERRQSLYSSLVAAQEFTRKSELALRDFMQGLTELAAPPKANRYTQFVDGCIVVIEERQV